MATTLKTRRYKIHHEKPMYVSVFGADGSELPRQRIRRWARIGKTNWVDIGDLVLDNCDRPVLAETPVAEGVMYQLCWSYDNNGPTTGRLEPTGSIAEGIHIGGEVAAGLECEIIGRELVVYEQVPAE